MNATKVNRYGKVNALVLPSIILVALITQIPILVTLGLSVVRWIIVRPDLRINFVGISNYIQLLTNPDFLWIIVNTIVMTVGSIVACTVLGLVISLTLNRQFPGVNIARTILIAPFFVMDAVAGIVWKTLMLHPSFGINSIICNLFGITPVDFLGHHPMFTVIMLVVWQWTPFFVLILLAGLQSIPEEIIESAKMDGAGWLRTILQIKIPAIANHIEVAVMLGLIFILKVFGLIYVTTAGGPGTASTNLPFIVYRTGFYRWDVGRAAAMAVITVILTLVFINLLFTFVRRKSKEVEA
jgi:sorbitol/mannitol transport system permease protein